MGPIATAIHQKLTDGLSPVRLIVDDDSARHAGHAGAAVHAAKQGGSADGVGETHFNVEVVSTAFAGLSRLARQRAVLDLVREELAGPVHAFSVKALTPEEAGL